MRVPVRKFLRGLFVAAASAAMTACVGISGDESRWPTVDQHGDAAHAPLSGVNAVRLRVAENALKSRDYDTAIRFFASIQEAEPGHLAPLMGLGEANLAKKDFEAAEIAFRKAVGAFPRRAETYEGLGRALVAKDDFRGAVDAFNRALSRAPSASLHNKLGVAHDLMGDGAGAQKHYRTALLLDPDIIGARNNLALSLAISQKYDEAINEMEQVAALPGATPRHRQNLAFVYGMAGQFDAVARILGKQPYDGAERERNETLFERIRTLAKAGDRQAVLSFLSESKEAGYVRDETPRARIAAVPGDRMPGNAAAHVPDARSLMAKKAGQPPVKAAEPKPEPKSEPRMARLTPAEPPAAAPEEPPEPARKRPESTAGGAFEGKVWRVQLASYRSEAMAIRGRNILEKLLGDKAGGIEVLVKRDRSPDSRLIDYRLRMMAVNSRAAGLRLCEGIRAAGHADCLVVLHNASLWQPSDPAAPAATAVADAGRAFRIQLASYRSKKGATRGRDILARILGRQVADQFDVMVRRDRVTNRTAFDYRIRSKPMMTHDEATRICEAIHRAGHPGCLIIRHNDRLWETAAANGDGVAYRVQLASYRHAAGAAEARKRIEALIAKRAGNIKIELKKITISPSEKEFYRVQTTPLESRRQAAKLCGELRAAGHDGCLILKV